MPSISINSFNFTVLGESVTVNVNFSISQTDTEKRLQIPGEVWFRLMEWDGAHKDTNYLSAQLQNEYRILDRDDDPAAGWQYAGFYKAGTFNYAYTLSRTILPGEPGSEEWYVVGECRADVRDSVATSRHLDLNLA